jgi:hypothetical protein
LFSSFFLIVSSNHKLLLIHNTICNDHLDKDLTNLDPSHKHMHKKMLDPEEVSKGIMKTQMVTVMLQNQKFYTKEIQIKKDLRLVEKHRFKLDLMLKLHLRLEADLRNNRIWAKTIWQDLMKPFQKEDQNHRSNLNIAVLQLLKVSNLQFSQQHQNNKRKWKSIKQLKN